MEFVYPPELVSKYIVDLEEYPLLMTTIRIRNMVADFGRQQLGLMDQETINALEETVEIINTTLCECLGMERENYPLNPNYLNPSDFMIGSRRGQK